MFDLDPNNLPDLATLIQWAQLAYPVLADVLARRRPPPSPLPGSSERQRARRHPKPSPKRRAPLRARQSHQAARRTRPPSGC